MSASRYFSWSDLSLSGEISTIQMSMRQTLLDSWEEDFAQEHFTDSGIYLISEQRFVSGLNVIVYK